MRYSDISDFKYLLRADYERYLPGWTWGAVQVGPCITISEEGLLRIAADYPWDGPSGPTVDRVTNMEGSLVHDALYEVIRAGAVPFGPVRQFADALMRDICIAAGMSPAWAKSFYYAGLRTFGAYAARCRKSKKYQVYIA